MITPLKNQKDVTALIGGCANILPSKKELYVDNMVRTK